jgi:subtilisin-like proprotein convertase family protein
MHKRRCAAGWLSTAAFIGFLATGAAAQPANDHCDTAQAVGEGIFPFDNTEADTDTAVVICVGEDFTGSDVWFRYTPSQSRRAIFDTCNSNFDTIITLIDECGGLELVCSNNQCGADGLQSRVPFDVSVGTSYLVRVAGYFGATGTGALRIAFQAGLSNDLCANATAIGEGTFPFNTDGANTDGEASCGSSGSHDIWYRYTPSGTGVATIQTCGAGNLLDSVLSVYTGCGGTELACNDDAQCAGGASRVTLITQAGSTYLIRIAGFDGSVGSGNLNVSFAPPPSSCIGQPPNSIVEPEACGAATNNGCDEPGAGFSTLTCGDSTVFGKIAVTATQRDVDWYRITLPGPASLTLTLQADFASRLRLTSATCPASPISVANAPTRCADTAMIAATLQPGEYAIGVEPLGAVAAPCGTANNYVLTVATSNCLPMGACCTGEGCTVATAVDCASFSGEYRGDGTVCSTTVLDPSFSSTDPPSPIPDADSDTGTPGETSMVLSIEGTGLMIPSEGIAVSVNLEHTSVGDLRLVLSSAFSAITFLDQVGFNGEFGRDDSDLSGQYDFYDSATGDIVAIADALGSDQVIPPGGYYPRSFGGFPESFGGAFAGTPLDGFWTLIVTDASIGGAGILNSFAVGLTATTSICATPSCPADFNGDGFINPDDLTDMITCFFLNVQFPGTCPEADFNADGFVNPDDLTDFITIFFLGC